MTPHSGRSSPLFPCRYFSVVLGIVAWLLTGCASGPDKLAYQPESQLVPYAQALTAPTQYQSQPVRWSGLIVQTRVLAGSSEIEIVYLPLKSNGQPEQQETSPGRFMASVHGLLDPELYAKGRSITVLGHLGRSVEGKIGEQSYRFPRVVVDEHTLWPKVKEVEVRYVRDPFDDFGFHHLP
jgi:outer membrane lipoprotein